jgi:hypothetical protein
MEKTKSNIEFSKKFVEESHKIDEGLKKVAEKLIAETKKENGCLILTDNEGNIKHVHAKDL